MTFAASPLAFQIRERRRQRRPGDAIADRVDGLGVEQLADGVDRVDLPVQHIIVERSVGDALVRRFPADHEQGDALVDAPFDEAFLRREVEDVEAIDPGREDDDRRLQHVRRGRRVLDQLVKWRSAHDLAGRGRQVAADLERPRAGLRQLPGRDVAEHVRQTLQQVLAAAVDGPLQDLRVSQCEVRRAHRIDEAARRETQPLPHLGVDIVDLVDRPKQLVGDLQVGLSNGVEDGVLAPLGGGEAAVLALGGVAGRRGRDSAQHLAPGFKALGPGLRPCGHQACRVGCSRGGWVLETES